MGNGLEGQERMQGSSRRPDRSGGCGHGEEWADVRGVQAAEGVRLVLD